MYPAAPALYDQLKRLVAIADKMREDGVAVDPNEVERWRLKLTPIHEQMHQALVAKAAEHGLEDFNPGSAQHMSKLFFGKLGLNPVEHTATGRAKLDKGILISFLAYPDEIRDTAKQVLEYRKVGKLLSTYIENLKPDANGLVHVQWLPQRAKTGRWSSKPNLQNVPEPVRSVYIPRHPDNFFVGADYSALEARIVASYARAETMLAWWAKDINFDIHTETACLVWPQKADEVRRVRAEKLKDTPEYKLRDDLKNTFYASLYVCGIPRLTTTLALKGTMLTQNQVRVLRDGGIFKVHHEIPKWHQDCIRQVASRDYMEEEIHHRRTYFHGRPDPSRCTNFMGQATAAAVVNNAVQGVAKDLRKGEYIIAQVHDELVLEGPDPDRLKSILKIHMERSYRLNGIDTFLPCTPKVGKNLAEI